MTPCYTDLTSPVKSRMHYELSNSMRFLCFCVLSVGSQVNPCTSKSPTAPYVCKSYNVCHYYKWVIFVFSNFGSPQSFWPSAASSSSVQSMWKAQWRLMHNFVLAVCFYILAKHDKPTTTKVTYRNIYIYSKWHIKKCKGVFPQKCQENFISYTTVYLNHK